MIDAPLVGPEHRDGPGDSEVAVSSRELEDPVTRSWNDRKAHFGKQLAGLERGRESPVEELIRRDVARAVGRPSDERCLESEGDRGELGGGVGVRQAAAYRPPVPDRRMRNQLQRV